MEGKELFIKIKANCMEHLKENGMSQQTINDILMAFHLVSAEMFDVLLKYDNERDGKKK